MKTFKKTLSSLFLSVIIFSFPACSDDDVTIIPQPEPNPYEEYNLTGFDVTFEDKVKRPLFELVYDENDKLSKATYYYYNIGEKDGDPTDVKMDQTLTYNYIHSGTVISVNCILIDHTDNDKRSEWITTLTTSNNGYIEKASNVSNEGTNIIYTWENGKLKNVYDYDFTYNGDNVEKAVNTSADSWDDYKYEDKCTYSLTCNTNNYNPFKAIPTELFAVMEDENMDMLTTILCSNEVKQVVHQDEYKRKNTENDNLVSENIEKEITDYTYIYDTNNLAKTVTVKYTYYRKYTDYVNPENSSEKTKDSGTSTIHFVYEKK